MRWSRTAKMIAAVALGGAAGIVACNTVLDTGKFTYGSCQTKGELRCQDNTLQVCAADGTWEAGTPCQGTACNVDAGACIGECEPSSGRCNPDGGPSIQKCDAVGRWGDDSACMKACVNATCASCAPGQFSCNATASTDTITPSPFGPVVLACDEHGVWTPGGTCPCVGGVCRDCLPGMTNCQGSDQVTCDDAGSWPDAGEPCPPGYSCDSSGGVGHCVLPCTTGSKQCDGMGTAQTCNSEQQWVPTETCRLPCSPCTGGKCTLMVGMGCAQNCIVSGTCSNIGECEANDGGAVECVGGGDGQCNLNDCDMNRGSCVAKQGTACSVDICQGSSSCDQGTCANVDHAWAHWSFAALPPDAGPRYVATSQVVYDAMTHLMWQRKPGDAAVDYSSAKLYCKCLNEPTNTQCDHVDGYPNGWRLPTRIELASTVVYGNAPSSNQLIDPAFYPPPSGADAGVAPGSGIPFWSISLVSTNLTAWEVDFSNGFVKSTALTQNAFVRCVR